MARVWQEKWRRSVGWTSLGASFLGTQRAGRERQSRADNPINVRSLLRRADSKKEQATDCDRTTSRNLIADQGHRADIKPMVTVQPPPCSALSAEAINAFPVALSSRRTPRASPFFQVFNPFQGPPFRSQAPSELEQPGGF